MIRAALLLPALVAMLVAPAGGTDNASAYVHSSVVPVVWRLVWPREAMAQSLELGIPVESLGALHTSGHYHVSALLDGLQVGHVRATCDVHAEPSAFIRQCSGALTLAPLLPGQHDILLVLHHMDGTRMDDTFVAATNLAVTVIDSASNSESGPQTRARDVASMAAAHDTAAGQFVPRDDLEAKAWSTAGYYRAGTRAEHDLAGVLVVVVANYGYCSCKNGGFEIPFILILYSRRKICVYSACSRRAYLHVL